MFFLAFFCRFAFFVFLHLSHHHGRTQTAVNDFGFDFVVLHFSTRADASASVFSNNNDSNNIPPLLSSIHNNNGTGTLFFHFVLRCKRKAINSTSTSRSSTYEYIVYPFKLRYKSTCCFLLLLSQTFRFSPAQANNQTKHRLEADHQIQQQ